MKKLILSIIAAFTFVFSAAAESKTLVVYFSRTGEQYSVGVIQNGNTEIIAEQIAEATGADLFEIVPLVDNYPTSYKALTDVASSEKGKKARPQYKEGMPELSKYDTVYIGAPVWWGDWPMIMYTFFEKEKDNLAGKTLYPFSTHAGSGLSGFDKSLQKAVPKATVGTGLAVYGSTAQNNREASKKQVQDWVSKNRNKRMDNAEKVIQQLYKDMWTYLIEKDMKGIADIHDEKFTLTHMTGNVQDKKQFMQAVEDGTLNYYSAEHESIKVSVSSNKAQIIGQSRVNAAVYGGGKHTWRLQQKMTVEYKNGRWILMSSMASTY